MIPRVSGGAVRAPLAILPAGATSETRLLLAARGLRAVGDGFVSLLLPVYLLELGYGPFVTGIIATATLAGSALLTLLFGLYAHRASGRSLLILGAIIAPTPTFLTPHDLHHLHRSTIGAKPVHHDDSWPALALHRPLQELKGGLAIPPLRGEHLEHLTFVINGAPQVVHLAVDPDEDLVQMPAPARIRSMIDPALSDFRGEHRTEPVPPKPHRFVADIDPALEQQIFYLPQRQRIADVHHDREADDLG